MDSDLHHQGAPSAKAWLLGCPAWTPGVPPVSSCSGRFLLPLAPCGAEWVRSSASQGQVSVPCGAAGGMLPSAGCGSAAQLSHWPRTRLAQAPLFLWVPWNLGWEPFPGSDCNCWRREPRAAAAAAAAACSLGLAEGRNSPVERKVLGPLGPLSTESWGRWRLCLLFMTPSLHLDTTSTHRWGTRVGLSRAAGPQKGNSVTERCLWCRWGRAAFSGVLGRGRALSQAPLPHVAAPLL